MGSRDCSHNSHSMDLEVYKVLYASGYGVHDDWHVDEVLF